MTFRSFHTHLKALDESFHLLYSLSEKVTLDPPHELS